MPVKFFHFPFKPNRYPIKTMSSDNTDFQIPESHLNILKIVSAMAWADGKLDKEEIDVLMEQFKVDLPVDPQPIVYLEENITFYDPFSTNPIIYEQIETRIKSESAFKDILWDYKDNPIPLPELVCKLGSIEDRCLAVKLSYMVIKACADKEGDLISPQEKVVYRQLLELTQLDNETVKKIEWKASQELEKFQHPFKALLHNVKSFLGKKITLQGLES